MSSTSQNTSYTVPITWSTTGNFEVRVTFGNSYLICYTSSKSLNGTSRVVVPDKIFDSDGGLTFCSPGETKAVSITPIPSQSIDNCYWHHSFDWIVPAGWSISVPNGYGATPIAGGVRTPSTTIYVTAPSTTLMSGFSGNYFITVKTEPAWQWPKQVTRQIWVGKYNGSVSFSGSAGVCNGSLYSYSVTPPGGQIYPGHTYQWTYPNGWQVYSQSGNQISLYVPMYNNSYGPVTAFFNNGCGPDQSGITTFPGFGCSTGSSLLVYPNPTTDQLSFTIEEGVAVDSPASISGARLLNSENQQVRSTGPGVNVIDVKGLPQGLYYIHVRVGDAVYKEQIIIK
jgi:hypothetical protein